MKILNLTTLFWLQGGFELPRGADVLTISPMIDEWLRAQAGVGGTGEIGRAGGAAGGESAPNSNLDAGGADGVGETGEKPRGTGKTSENIGEKPRGTLASCDFVRCEMGAVSYVLAMVCAQLLGGENAANAAHNVFGEFDVGLLSGESNVGEEELPLICDFVRNCSLVIVSPEVANADVLGLLSALAARFGFKVVGLDGVEISLTLAAQNGGKLCEKNAEKNDTNSNLGTENGANFGENRGKNAGGDNRSEVGGVLETGELAELENFDGAVIFTHDKPRAFLCYGDKFEFSARAAQNAGENCAASAGENAGERGENTGKNQSQNIGETDFRGGRYFAAAAKLRNGQRVKIRAKSGDFDAVFVLDEALKGTAGFLGNARLTFGFERLVLG